MGNGSKRLSKTAAILAGTAGAAAGLYGIGVGVFYSLAFARKPWIKMKGGPSFEEGSPAAIGQQWLHDHDRDVRERVAKDGTRLYCHYFPAENARFTVIEFHGWRSRWDIDFSASSPYLNKLGANLLLVEQRGMGRCGGKCITFGLEERFDVPEWVQWYQETYNSQIPIVIAGISLGSATVMMASAEKYPPQVRGILADCGYNSPYDIIRKVAKASYHVPEHPACDTINFLFRLRTGHDLKEYSGAEAAAHATVPILFVHGDRDGFVPDHMSREVYDACSSRKEYFLVKGAVHGNSFLVETEEYIRRMQDFFGLA